MGFYRVVLQRDNDEEVELVRTRSKALARFAFHLAAFVGRHTVRVR